MLEGVYGGVQLHRDNFQISSSVRIRSSYYAVHLNFELMQLCVGIP